MHDRILSTRIIRWLPRLLAMLYALFLSLFAFDVFGEGYGPGETILALLIHLIPTFLVMVALVVAWRREGIGAMLFFFLAVSAIIFTRGNGWVMYGPLFFLAVLFLSNRLYHSNRSA